MADSVLVKCLVRYLRHELAIGRVLRRSSSHCSILRW
jgi:hypothetical protein